MSTHRERRERKAERLEEWAGNRQQQAGQVFRDHEKYRGDHAFNFQPGHIPERARVIAREERAHESARKAQDMNSRAENIRAQLARSIYDDDADAVEQLEAKLAHLEDRREKIKAYNAACRKAGKSTDWRDDPAGVAERLRMLEPEDREDVLTSMQVAAYNVGTGGSAPRWMLSNLGGTIGKTRDRLTRLKHEREHGPADRIIVARRTSDCETCGARLAKGDTIRYNRQQGARCLECPKQEGEDARAA